MPVTAAVAETKSEGKVIGRLQFLMPDIQPKLHSIRYFTVKGESPAPAFETVYVNKLALAELGIPLSKVIRVTVEVMENDAHVRPPSPKLTE